jgi:hypothetical protein
LQTQLVLGKPINSEAYKRAKQILTTALLEIK